MVVQVEGICLAAMIAVGCSTGPGTDVERHKEGEPSARPPESNPTSTSESDGGRSPEMTSREPSSTSSSDSSWSEGTGEPNSEPTSTSNSDPAEADSVEIDAHECEQFTGYHALAFTQNEARASAIRDYQMDGPPPEFPQAPCWDCLGSAESTCKAPRADECAAIWSCVERHCFCRTCAPRSSEETSMCSSCIESCMPSGHSRCRQEWNEYVPCVVAECASDCQ